MNYSEARVFIYRCIDGASYHDVVVGGLLTNCVRVIVNSLYVLFVSYYCRLMVLTFEPSAHRYVLVVE